MAQRPDMALKATGDGSPGGGGMPSAAMTLDVYAGVFESDLDTVAENVAKMWPVQPSSVLRSRPKWPPNSGCSAGDGSAPIRIELF
jgi:hypothetical protein